MVKVTLKEQETTVNLDYFLEIVDIYTSRKEVYRTLEKALGDPDRKSFVKGKVVGGCWRIPFSEREKIRKIFSIRNMDI